MPLFDVIGLGGEKHAVVIDIGAAYTKCGFASETSPRHIIRSVVTHTINGETETVNVITNEQDRRPDELYAILRDFLHQVYFRYLLVNPRDRRVVICESVLCSTLWRNTIAKVLFKHFEVPSLLFAPHHLLALFTLGVPSGLVLDCSLTETVVLPIYEGTAILKAVETIPLGSQAIHKYLEKQLMDRSLVQIETGIKPLSSVMNAVETETLEDIKVRTCFVAPKFSGPEGEPRPASQVPKVDYPLDGGRILRIEGQIREQTFDILFDGDEEEKSIATCVLDSILKCPIDTRKTLAENIVLIGGTVMTPGFKHRLLQEIYCLLQSPRYKENLFIKTIKMHRTPVSPNCTSWLGGAIFGALEVLADRSVTKERYIQDNKIPDWASCEVQALDNIPILDAPLERPVLSRRQTSGITSTLSSISSTLSSRLLSGGSPRSLGSSLLQRAGASPSSGASQSIKETDRESQKEEKE
ncbi:actin-related protein 10-like [Orbicella faveolata]|uniref:actin-related protein 10-like n=1 Tax=Orbicella faveolata TaxID=48498 RepID=UPI0009E5CEE9|nr:actin-related protein 10-like [Orbicella faveolata]